MSNIEKSELAPGIVHESSLNQSSASSHTQDGTVHNLEAQVQGAPSVLEKEQPVSEQNEAPQPPSAPPPPPNGGRLAWTQVFCGFLLFFNTFGILTSFGVFQTFYESSSSPFQRSSSDISWIGSIQAFLLQFIGLFAGPVFDKGYLRILICVGSFGVVFGHMMLSLASEYWEILLAQGFCVGIGMGCLYLPSISILPAYFSTRLGLAIGLASSGSAVGGVVYPIILQRLIGEIGFPWAVRVVGFVALAGLLVPIAFMRQRFKPAKARALIDWTAFSDLPFVWFAVATSIGFMGVFGFQSYFSFYAEQQGIASTAFAFNLVSIYNGMSAFGRIIPNALSDKVGQFNILAPSALFCSVVYFCTIAVHSLGPMIGVTILAGFFLGVITALPPLCFTILTKDKSKIGTRVGTGFAIIAPGILISGPAAGGILQRSDPLDWPGLYSYAGAATFVAATMYFILRVARGGFNPLVKV